MMRTTVFLCLCGSNIAERIDAFAVEAAVNAMPTVDRVVTVPFLCSAKAVPEMVADLVANMPDRVVVAACSPRDHEETFKGVLRRAGMSPFLMQMANIRELVAWVTADRDAATRKAISMIRAAVERVVLHESIPDESIPASSDAMVVGAGPAGMTAALALSEAGRKVTLVERNPNIGGLPVLYEEIFPVMECGTCLLDTPMQAVLHGEKASRIETMTLSEVVGVKGFFGNFVVSVRRKPRFVDPDRCIGCGECVPPCPVVAPDPRNGNRATRGAIAFPYAGCLPNLPAIDPSVCLRLNGTNDCRLCADACPVGPDVIRFDEVDEVVERTVGGVVLATGASLLDQAALTELSGGGHPAVMSSLQFERLLSSNGPTEGAVVTHDGRDVRSVVIVHCAGSLDPRHAPYCSGICCGTAFKFTHLLGRKALGTTVTHLVREVVLPGTESFDLYRSATERYGVRVFRYRSPDDISVSDGIDGAASVRFVDEAGRDGVVEGEIVVLMLPIVPSPATAALAKIFDAGADAHGFISAMHPRIDATRSPVRGVYLAGTCRGPGDIAFATTDGSSSAGRLLSELVEGRTIPLEPACAVVDAERCSGCRVCGAVCPYKAVVFDLASRRTSVNALLCRGCGACVAACPSGAIANRQFTDAQLLAEVRGLLR